MLGRLIKHEIRATARLIPVCYIAIITAFLTGLIGNAIKNSYLHNLSNILMVILVFAVNIITFVVVVTRYYNNLFGSEGYLTGTLPVDKSKILASKAIVGFAWIIMSYIATAFCTWGLLYNNNVISIDFFNHSLFDLIKMVFENKTVRFTFFYFLVAIIIQTILSIATIYCAITIAHTKPFIKHPVAFSILWYFIISTVVDIINAILIFIPFGINTATGRIVARSMIRGDGVLSLSNLFASLVISAVLFVITNSLLYKKTSVR